MPNGLKSPNQPMLAASYRAVVPNLYQCASECLNVLRAVGRSGKTRSSDRELNALYYFQTAVERLTEPCSVANVAAENERVLLTREEVLKEIGTTEEEIERLTIRFAEKAKKRTAVASERQCTPEI